MDTEAFDCVLGTDSFVQHSQIQFLTLQAPYLLYVDHGNGRESVPLEQSEYISSYLRSIEGGLSTIGGSPRPRSEGVRLLQRRPEPGVVRQRQATCLGPLLQQREKLLLQIVLALFRDRLREPQVQ